MRKIKITISISIVLFFASCSSTDYYLCQCKHGNLQKGELVTTTDTLRNMSKEEAEIECSNYQTTDDPNGAINCELKED